MDIWNAAFHISQNGISNAILKDVLIMRDQSLNFQYVSIDILGKVLYFEKVNMSIGFCGVWSNLVLYVTKAVEGLIVRYIFSLFLIVWVMYVEIVIT